MSGAIYISGAMTGKPDLNYPAFNTMAAKLQANGAIVVNPAEQPEHASWEAYMRHDLRLLLDCTAIFMLEGWQFSRGALLEHQVATALGMLVLYEGQVAGL